MRLLTTYRPPSWPTASDDIQAAVLADERSAKWMEGKQVVKVIVVPKKIINIVVK